MKFKKNISKSIFSLITAFSLAGAIAGFNNTKVSAKPDGRYYAGYYTTHNVNEYLNVRTQADYNSSVVKCDGSYWTIRKNDTFMVYSTKATYNGHYGEVKKKVRNNTVIGWVNLAFAKEDYKADAQEGLYSWYVLKNYSDLYLVNIDDSCYYIERVYKGHPYKVNKNNIYGSNNNLYNDGAYYANLDYFQPSKDSKGNIPYGS